MALTKISTEGFKDDAVTTDKIADSINSERTANTAKDLTALSASNLTSGTVPDARFPATLPAKSAANLTNIPAANITGTLPAISGVNLTDLPASGKATNLIINGAFTVKQRGTSSTANNGYYTVDRWSQEYGSVDEAPTFSVFDVSPPSSPYHLPVSGDHPYKEGFRTAWGVTNGNQTGGAGADDYILMGHAIEAQDIAKSGWNYTDPNSKITLSFWVKSSVSQAFFGQVLSQDGSVYNFPFSTGSLTAMTLTKVTVTISGNANLQFDDNNGSGLRIYLWAFAGTNLTGSVTQNAWSAVNWSQRIPDNTSTWYTTNDASLQITGVQLEVGDSASAYAHESYAETLRKCQRYFQVLIHRKSGDNGVYFGGGYMYDHYRAYLPVTYYVEMRAAPSFQHTNGSSYYSLHRNGVGDNFDGWNTAIGGDNKHVAIQAQSGLSGTGGQMGGFWSNADGAKITFEAEL